MYTLKVTYVGGVHINFPNQMVQCLTYVAMYVHYIHIFKKQFRLSNKAGETISMHGYLL